MEKFRKLKLSKEILTAIEKAGFSEPSEIQEKTIPLILEGKDILGSSATGSGKTLAFGAGIIEKIKRGGGIQAIILTPTRELTLQVARHLKFFSEQFNLRITEVYGGVSITPQIKSLTKTDIVVGTPGRILDHLNRGTLDLRKIKFLVLDEADRMLDMGFLHDVEKIIQQCPKERQTLLFSATISHDIERIAHKYMKHPLHIEVEPYVDPSKLSQIFYDVHPSMKFSLLVHLLKKEKSNLIMVFCNTRRNTDLVAKNLKKNNLYAMAIHGGLSQNKRNNILKSFHEQETLILVCTDIAARGLDIKDISHIYNYDIPANSTDYIHRIGRTARAGKEGIAISLVSMKDYENFRSVNEDESLKIKQKPLPEMESIPFISSRYSERSDREQTGNKGRGRWDNNRRDRNGRRGSGRREFNREGRSEFRGRDRSRKEEGSERHNYRGSFHSRSRNNSNRNSNRRSHSFKPRGRY